MCPWCIECVFANAGPLRLMQAPGRRAATGQSPVELPKPLAERKKTSDHPTVRIPCFTCVVWALLVEPAPQLVVFAEARDQAAKEQPWSQFGSDPLGTALSALHLC